MKELEKYFAEFLKTGTTPGHEDVKPAIKESKKAKGQIHKRDWEVIKKKVWNMIQKQKKEKRQKKKKE